MHLPVFNVSIKKVLLAGGNRGTLEIIEQYRDHPVCVSSRNYCLCWV